MTTRCPHSGSAFRVVLAVAVGLSLAPTVHLHGSAVDGGTLPGRPQSAHSGQKAAPRSGVCEREATKLVDQKPVRVGRSIRAPKKLRGSPPHYPELPPGTVGSGSWLGEVLINNAGTVAHVWPIREVTFVPPFPAFNDAISDALQQWAFEPLLVNGKPMPFCMTVTVNINWR